MHGKLGNVLRICYRSLRAGKKRFKISTRGAGRGEGGRKLGILEVLSFYILVLDQALLEDKRGREVIDKQTSDAQTSRERHVFAGGRVK